MAKKIARLVMALIGVMLGVALVIAADGVVLSLTGLGLFRRMWPWGVTLTYVAGGLFGAIIFYIISPKLIDAFVSTLRKTEEKLSEMALADILLCVVGLLIGLLIAFLLGTLTAGIGIAPLRFLIDLALYTAFGYLGWSVMKKRRGEITAPNWFSRGKGKHLQSGAARPKVLDTSVIIDGRIADICRTGVIEGTLIVPRFVLHELQHIADSADALKRNRGRRGLDILKEMQEDNVAPVKVVENDYDDIAEVDAKLIRLALEMGGVVVTNDYNLNKVAGVQKVPVLNINELANAIKPVALPGEEMRLTVVKEGKEAGQGVGYLSDGTMIVVDGGKRCIGEDVTVLVTSVLQTPAGRMIFAKIK